MYPGPQQAKSQYQLQNENYLQVTAQNNAGLRTEESKEEFDSPKKVMYAELIRQSNQENATNYEQLTRNTGNN